VIFRACLLMLVMVPPAMAQNVPPLAGMPCLQTGSVVEYTPAAGNRALIVTDKLRRQYRLEFTAVCDSLQPHASLGFKTFNPSQYSCMARGDSVYSSTDVGANRLCRIGAIDYFNAEPPEPPPPPPVAAGHARG
jgi:hypothetical protein